MLYVFVDHYSQWLDDVGLFRYVQLLYQLEFRAFFSVVVSFVFVLLFGRRTIAWLIRQKIGDTPLMLMS